jgi:metacaspase-1
MQGFSESESIGAMTGSFIRAVEAEPGTTYGRLLSAMRATIRDGHGSPRLGSFVRRMIVSSGVQVRDGHVNPAGLGSQFSHLCMTN